VTYAVDESGAFDRDGSAGMAAEGVYRDVDDGEVGDGEVGEVDSWIWVLTDWKV
jgi:hypothetical protein